MLRTLTIRDFVIVDTIELEFSNGFTVLTGETGAGKSILIDALQLALGGRGDASMVRPRPTSAPTSPSRRRRTCGWNRTSSTRTRAAHCCAA